MTSHGNLQVYSRAVAETLRQIEAYADQFEKPIDSEDGVERSWRKMVASHIRHAASTVRYQRSRAVKAITERMSYDQSDDALPNGMNPPFAEGK